MRFGLNNKGNCQLVFRRWDCEKKSKSAYARLIDGALKLIGPIFRPIYTVLQADQFDDEGNPFHRKIMKAFGIPRGNFHLSPDQKAFLKNTTKSQRPSTNVVVLPPKFSPRAPESMIGTAAPMVWFKQLRKSRFVPGGKGVIRLGSGSAESSVGGSSLGKLAWSI